MQKTKYVIVYLHGFSASHMEGDPVHKYIARKYNMNLFLSRLEGHGLRDSNSFEVLNPQNYLNSAIEAIRVGEVLGDSIILMSCSSGSTLAILVDGLSPKIAAHLMYAPNIDMANKTSNLITKPWGKYILKLFLGGEYNKINYNDTAKLYWNEIYHFNGIVALKWILKNYMIEDNFKKIKTPLFVSYFKMDDRSKDDVVDVDKIDWFYNTVSTPKHLKMKYISTSAGAHVVTSPIFSKDVDNVIKYSELFLKQTLRLKEK
ncbi:MAG TPA: hypothetical protein PKD85_09015 [Saprospiraceae bacterium]|nr:hypothetical protein [Saprospiraceae bacterium]